MVLFGGAELGSVIAEVATVLALLFVIGVQVATVALAIAYATVIHPVAVWVALKDPAISQIYLRPLSVSDCYAPAARTSDQDIRTPHRIGPFVALVSGYVTHVLLPARLRVE